MLSFSSSSNVRINQSEQAFETGHSHTALSCLLSQIESLEGPKTCISYTI